MATLKVRELGEYIREQRTSTKMSLRQLAKLAGVSNPYLSQIERGLRKPSAEILQQIAKALRISAEALYVQAGILEERPGGSAVPDAILRDELITERQKNVLLEIYDSFRKENDAARAAEPAAPAAAEPVPGESEVRADESAPVEPADALAPRRGSSTRTARRRRSVPNGDGSSVDPTS